MDNPAPNPGPYKRTLEPMTIVVTVVVVAAVVLVLFSSRHNARPSRRGMPINSLRQIDGAKEQYAHAYNLTPESIYWDATEKCFRLKPAKAEIKPTVTGSRP